MKDLYTQEVKGFRYLNALRASYEDPDEGLRRFTQAYLACVAAVDDCIGQVIEAVDNSPLRENTIIVVTSDHGWSMGQKDWLFKNAPWEESTRIPLIIRAPGITTKGGVAEHPVSLIDIYPTLVDLCGLESDTRKNDQGAPLDGHSMRPFLENPKADSWDGPEGALSMVFANEAATTPLSQENRTNPAKQHFSLRTKDWRYILYNNGMEELYDHDADPQEWKNLADHPDYAAVKQRLYDQLAVQACFND